MSQEKPYNPLQKRNLAESIARAILDQKTRPMSETEDLHGAGVYIIYYTGDNHYYSQVAKRNAGGQFSQPIYVGKAIPRGGRKGGFADDDSAGRGKALRDRIAQHHGSIVEATNLKVADFAYRALVVDEIFIPLGENMLIEQFRPVWNLVIDGFGNKDPGRRRKDQYRSAWDVLHPGRKFAEKLGDNPIGREVYLAAMDTFYKTGKIIRLKKPLGGEQIDQEDDEESGEA